VSLVVPPQGINYQTKEQVAQMNTAQVEAHKVQLGAEQKIIEAAITEAIATKSFDNLGELEKRIGALAEARAELKAAAETAARDEKYAAVMADGGSLADGPIPDSSAHDDGRRLAFNAKTARGLIERKAVAANGAAVAQAGLMS
jgi:hypothetical protein